MLYVCHLKEIIFSVMSTNSYLVHFLVLCALITPTRAWTKLGNDIDGEAAGDESGPAVAL